MHRDNQNFVLSTRQVDSSDSDSDPAPPLQIQTASLAQLETPRPRKKASDWGSSQGADEVFKPSGNPSKHRAYTALFSHNRFI